jgi:hypothetical protein
MSEQVKIYVPLLGEGTDVWRPAMAELRSDGTYKVLGPIPDTEHWAFVPGTLVRCHLRALSDDLEDPSEVLVAEEQISN